MINGQGQIETLTFALAYDKDDKLTLTFNGISYSYTIPVTGAFSFNPALFLDAGGNLLSNALILANVSHVISGNIVTFSDSDASLLGGSFSLSASINEASATPAQTTFKIVAPEKLSSWSLTVGGEKVVSAEGDGTETATDTVLGNLAAALNAKFAAQGLSFSYSAASNLLQVTGQSDGSALPLLKFEQTTGTSQNAGVAENSVITITSAVDGIDNGNNVNGLLTINNLNMPFSLVINQNVNANDALDRIASAIRDAVNARSNDLGVTASSAGPSVKLTFLTTGNKVDITAKFDHAAIGDNLTFSISTSQGSDGQATIVYTTTEIAAQSLSAGIKVSNQGAPNDQVVHLARDPLIVHADNQTVAEGNSPASIVTVTISRPSNISSGAATVFASLAPGSAQGGVDYAAGMITVNFAPGQSTAQVSFISIGDTIIEPSKALTLNVYSTPDQSTLLASAIITLANDDGVVFENSFGPGKDLLHAVSSGPETLAGGAGDDQYLVNSIDDVIVEGPNGGVDTVFTAASYTLNGGSFVESLSTQTHSSTDPINLIGNFHDQLIIGNFGNNVLNGNGGVDTLIGLQGDDIYVVGDAAAQIIEKAGEGFDVAYASVSYSLGAGVSIEVLSTQTVAETTAINLTGNEFSQLVIGNVGSNVLNGGSGSDTLVGLGGADTFAFTTALGPDNVDTIQDFEAGIDKIGLSSAIFGNLDVSAAGTWFTTGSAATTADHRIIYDQATGKLFYDADGSGAGQAALFAQVTPGTAITPADTVIIP